MTRRHATVAAIIILTVIVLDQILKFWVKTTFYLGEDMQIFPSGASSHSPYSGSL